MSPVDSRHEDFDDEDFIESAKQESDNYQTITESGTKYNTIYRLYFFLIDLFNFSSVPFVFILLGFKQESGLQTMAKLRLPGKKYYNIYMLH